MKHHTAVARTVAVAGLAAGFAFGGAGQAAAFHYSPEQRIYTLGEEPRCPGGTVDIAIARGEYEPNQMRANFTTHLYSPAWSGSANYECYLTINAAWHNHETGASGTVAHQVASWRFQGPNVKNPYIDIDTGVGPVTVTFTTNTAHTPSPTFQVPAT